MTKITAQDIDIINEALCKGMDVCIQNTPDGGFRIVSHRVSVLKRSEKKKTQNLGFSDKRE